MESDPPSWSLPCPLQCGTPVLGSYQSQPLALHGLWELTGQTLRLTPTCCSVSSVYPPPPCFRLWVLRACLGPLLTDSPWNRVLTLLSNFAHMSTWISDSVPPSGCTRSPVSSACSATIMWPPHIPVTLGTNACVQHTRICSLGWLPVPHLPLGGQGGGAARPPARMFGLWVTPRPVHSSCT